MSTKVVLSSLSGLVVVSFLVLGNAYAVKEVDSKPDNPKGIIDPLFKPGEKEGIIDPLFKKGQGGNKGIIDPLFKKNRGHSGEDKGIIDPLFKPNSDAKANSRG